MFTFKKRKKKDWGRKMIVFVLGDGWPSPPVRLHMKIAKVVTLTCHSLCIRPSYMHFIDLGCFSL